MIVFTVPSSPTGLQAMVMYNQYGSTDSVEMHFMGVVSSAYHFQISFIMLTFYSPPLYLVVAWIPLSATLSH